MLDPDYIANLSEEILEMYALYELSVLTDIARRISKTNYATPTAIFQLQQLNNGTAIYSNAIKEISKLTGKSEAEVTSLFEDATVKNMRLESAIAKDAGIITKPLAENLAILQIMKANILKTNDHLANLTLTTAADAQALFVKSTNLAHLQVTSGAFSADKAINNAIKMASAEGLKVTYASGAVRSIEGAVRNAVITSVNQTAGKITEQSGTDMDAEYYEVSAHAGARDTGIGPANHLSWQGKVYKIKGKTAKYQNFVTVTGYGTGPGLAGYGCRHSFYSYFEGTSKAYSKAVLDSYKNDNVKYNGETISRYEATQKQRGIERNIRKYKTESKMMIAGGQDPSFANAKVRHYQAEARSFIKQTNLRRDYNREKIA